MPSPASRRSCAAIADLLPGKARDRREADPNTTGGPRRRTVIGRLTAGAQVCVVGDPPVPGPSSPSFITSALALIPWVHLDSADVPGEHDQLRLMQRGQEFSIRVGSIELMIGRLSGSEQALATLTCARLQDRPDARVLIGGLGMGFTLRAALDRLGPEARVVVAELVPVVAAWARGAL